MSSTVNEMPQLPDLLKRAMAGEVISTSDPFSKPKKPDFDTEQLSSTEPKSPIQSNAFDSVLNDLHMQQLSR